MNWVSPGQRALAILKDAKCIRLSDLAARLCVEESTAQQYVSLARDLTAGTDWYITTEYRPGPGRGERMIHQLKIWPVYFQPILDGKKTFELRKNDRGFNCGDILWLREWNPPQPYDSPIIPGYTKRELKVEVTYVLPIQGMEEPWCCMSIKPLEEQ